MYEGGHEHARMYAIHASRCWPSRTESAFAITNALTFALFLRNSKSRSSANKYSPCTKDAAAAAEVATKLGLCSGLVVTLGSSSRVMFKNVWGPCF